MPVQFRCGDCQKPINGSGYEVRVNVIHVTIDGDMSVITKHPSLKLYCFLCGKPIVDSITRNALIASVHQTS